ncbi:MAG: DNA repair protein RecN [Candidatus Aminicenantes bacterium]
MIKSLRISNLATIEDLELRLDKGFSILTGETGAGKSIIIDGIRLVLGEKATTDLIRTGKQETTVEAIFYLPQAKQPAESENELFLQRKILEKGTGKSYLNGVLVPIKKLKEMSGFLVDIYGQNDHVFLQKTENQLNYVDHYANALYVRREVSGLAKKLKKLLREKEELEIKEREREQKLDFLDFQIKEIEKAQLREGEEKELLGERNILKNAERIYTLVEEALDISYNQENALSPLLAKLQPIVRELSAFNEAFSEIDEAINQFHITVEEFSDFLIKFKEKQSASPEKLETIEERLSQIEKLKRKYGSDDKQILDYLKKAKKEYQQLSTSQEKFEDLQEEIVRVFNLYRSRADKLSKMRRESSRRLEKQMEREINLLGMRKAKFRIKITSSPLRLEAMAKIKESGTEDVEFLISPNPGEELRPMRKIASGGELSRIMLALKSIGKETERLKTLVFDEIDSGIGGKTAEFVAQKLRALSDQHQVICITHLPQIASFATQHFRIEKRISKKRTFTKIKKLAFEERVNEIARLSTGSRITDTALRNAREILSHNLGLRNGDKV